MEKIQIVPWEPGLFPNIDEASFDQLKCFQEIRNLLDNDSYIDIKGYDAYLYCYYYDLGKRFYGSDEHIENIDCSYRNFIKNYEYNNPKVTSYYFKGLFYADLVLQREPDIVIADFERYVAFIERTADDISPDPDIYIWALFMKGAGIKKGTRLPISWFDALYGRRFDAFLTDIGRENRDEVFSFASRILEEDQKKSHTNYLFRMFDFVAGVAYADKHGPNVALLKKQRWMHRPISVKTLVYNDKRDLYLKDLAREAENVFRVSAGMSEVGEGWVSETLLYKQIEAAFTDYDVIPHARPLFLGRQHYDVYLPEQRIALEYQGDQHSGPVDFFGGIEAFEKNKERDERKKQISKDNGIKLIEVFPGYKVEDIIRDILKNIKDPNSSEYQTELSKALEGLKQLTLNEETAKTRSEKASKKVAKSAAKREIKERDVDKRISELLSCLSKSAGGMDRLSNFDPIIWKSMTDELTKAEELSKTDPEEANRIAISLFESGYHESNIYYFIAKNYKKIGLLEKEREILLQLKKDYPNSSDTRLRKIIRDEL